MAFTLFYQIFFALSLISIPFYLLFLITIVRFRKIDPFKSSFFCICLSVGICDLISILNSWLLFRFPSFNWLGLDQYAKDDTRGLILAKIATIISWHCGMHQHIAVATLAFNRLTALVFSGWHELVS